MKGLMKRRGRLVRVRHVQHMLATAEVVHARDEATQIESNARRLANVREELFNTNSQTDGASLAAYRELADRLLAAGRQLDGALDQAKRRVVEKDAKRVIADREREIAERLKDKARRAWDNRVEARLAALPLYKRIQMKGEGEQ